MGDYYPFVSRIYLWGTKPQYKGAGITGYKIIDRSQPCKFYKQISAYSIYGGFEDTPSIENCYNRKIYSVCYKCYNEILIELKAASY